MPYRLSAREFLDQHSTPVAPPVELTGGSKHQTWLCVDGATAEVSFGGELLSPAPSTAEGKLQARAKYWGVVATRAVEAFEQYKQDLLLAVAPEEEGQLTKLRRLRWLAREMTARAKLFADAAAEHEDPGVKAQRAMLERRKSEALAFREKVLEVKR
jgi:hypothetical protein